MSITQRNLRVAAVVERSYLTSFSNIADRMVHLPTHTGAHLCPSPRPKFHRHVLAGPRVGVVAQQHTRT